jgi:hypothetical protein
MTLLTAAAAALRAPKGLWIGMIVVAVALLLAAAYIWGHDSADGVEQERERKALDGLIRDGQAVRERIVQEKLSDDDARDAGASWDERVTSVLADQFPAYVDAFRLAQGDPEHFSGQALAIRTINVKLEVLRQAHREARP